ncbi:MAG TPA: hypothetical protein VIH00_13250, partial [Candidatus Limnocylindrales bacterium]
MTALRLTPTFLIGSRRSFRLVERNIYVYRHTWLIILSGFFEPLFYLLGIGFGLGALIGTVPGPGGEPIPYQLFVAPALLASSSMNGAISEATFNFFFKLNYNKTFASILSTPLSPGDVAVGELMWALIRGGLYAIGFMVVMAVLGLIVSPWVVLAVPAALLIGFGLGALIGTIPGPGGVEISYQLFLAPALLASSAMNGAIMESTFNFFFKLNYNKTFASILATPLSPGDIALGELGWALIR